MPVKRLKALWQRYRHLAAARPLVAFFIVFFIGIMFWGAFNTSLELTNTETFCISCHEMEQYVYAEYKETLHYSNRSGVRATCPDCHVPREWAYMVVRKIGATNELYHKLAGSIDTEEKFHAKRLELAGYVWKKMRATDSRECRNCHNLAVMAINAQQANARRAHERAIEKDQTCIDCHMGIAHHIPADFDSDGSLHKQYEEQGRPCADCHAGMAQPEQDW
jgi:cytochrome c-type protein NapC